MTTGHFLNIAQNNRKYGACDSLELENSKNYSFNKFIIEGNNVVEYALVLTLCNVIILAFSNPNLF